MSLPALTIDISPGVFYYPQMHSKDAEGIAVIKRMHEIFAKFLMETLKTDCTITLPPDLEFSHPVYRFETLWQKYLFSKGCTKKDWVRVQLDTNDITMRINKAILKTS